MTVYINNYSMICSLGSDKDSIAKKITDPATNNSSQYILNDKKETVVFKVVEDLPTISNPKFQSRNNQFVLKLINSLSGDIATAIEKFGKDRIGIIIGTSTSGIEEGVQALESGETLKCSDTYDYQVQELGSPALFIKEQLGLESFAYTISTACSSAARTFIEAKSFLELDLCDAVIVGGADSLSEMTLNGFHALESVSELKTNPLSQNRCGINIGEGAALFLLTKEEGKYTFLGGGESTDAYHITSPEPHGLGAKKAMEMALADAKVLASEVDYINLHATGTEKNDAMESIAVSEIFSNDPFVSGTKPLVGHTLGAAGAIELGFCLMALDHKEGFLPIHSYDGEYDSGLPKLNLVDSNRPVFPKICMSNTYAFGGNNASLIVGKL